MTKRGYVRPHKRLTADGQIKTLIEYGVPDRYLYVEGRGGETLAEAIKALRKGDELCVVHAWLLSPPRKDRRERPHRNVVKAVQRAEDKGASVVEVSTGRTFSGRERDEIFADVVDWYAGKSKGVASAENGVRGGRPPIEHTPEEIEAAKRIWFDRRIKTWRDTAEPLRAFRFSPRRAYSKWGARDA